MTTNVAQIAYRKSGIAIPQLHFHVSDRIAKAIQHKAEQAGMSVSRYIAELVNAISVTIMIGRQTTSIRCSANGKARH
jgi:hypothetical protein